MCLGGLDSYFLFQLSDDAAENTNCKVCRIAIVVGPTQTTKFPEIRDNTVGILGLDNPDTVSFDNIMSVLFLFSISLDRSRPVLEPFDRPHWLINTTPRK